MGEEVMSNSTYYFESLPYAEGLTLQQQFAYDVEMNQEAFRLILCQHSHVYTFGKSANAANMLIDKQKLKEIGAEIQMIDRGGDVTYHGPGQLVGYPIMNLNKQKLSVRSYVNLLEEALIEVCKYFGLAAGRRESMTGVWLDAGNNKPERKIAAIGIRIKKGITMHGFALNVSTDLSYFNHIVPCGLVDKSVTSIAAETGVNHQVADVAEVFKHCFHSVFKLSANMNT